MSERKDPYAPYSKRIGWRASHTFNLYPSKDFRSEKKAREFVEKKNAELLPAQGLWGYRPRIVTVQLIKAENKGA